MKNMSKDASWTLAPLAAVAVQVGPQPVHMTVWNLIFGVCLFVVHYGLMKGISMASGQEDQARVKLYFPSLSFTLVVFLYQGTTFSAYKVLMLGYFPYYPLAIVTLIVVSFGLPMYVWHWNRTNALLLTWTSGHTIPLRFVPTGVWGPDSVDSQFFIFFSEFRETQRTFKVKQLLFSHAIALTTSIETQSVGACHAQIGVCIALLAWMIFLYGKDCPLRWPILNYTRILILLTQMVQLAMFFFSADVVAEETVFMLSTIFCLVDGLATWICFARDQMLSDLFRSGATLGSNTTGQSWWKYWSADDHNRLSRNANIADEHSASLPPVEMMPTLSLSSPPLPLAQATVVAKDDHRPMLPSFAMMPQPSFALLHPSSANETVVIQDDHVEMPQLSFDFLHPSSANETDDDDELDQYL